MKKLSYQKSNILVFASFIIIIFFSSCLGMKGGGGKSGKSLYITFFTADKSTQYFIKPLTFKNAKKESIICDFTFKNKANSVDTATMNVSIVSLVLLKSVDSIIITNPTARIKLCDNQFLFTERQKKFFNSRYSFKIPVTELKKLFENEDWELTFYSGENSGQFFTKHKTKRKLQKLSYEIFDLI